MKGREMMELLPWWIYLVILGIVFCGFMVIFTEKKEQEIEDEFIEQDGTIFIERMKKEKEKRKGKDA